MSSLPEVSGVLRHVRIRIGPDFDMPLDTYRAYSEHLVDASLSLVLRFNRENPFATGGGPVPGYQPLLGAFWMSAAQHPP